MGDLVLYSRKTPHSVSLSPLGEMVEWVSFLFFLQSGRLLLQLRCFLLARLDQHPLDWFFA